MQFASKEYLEESLKFWKFIVRKAKKQTKKIL